MRKVIPLGNLKSGLYILRRSSAHNWDRGKKNYSSNPSKLANHTNDNKENPIPQYMAPSPGLTNDPSWLKSFIKGMEVFPNFVTSSEEASLMAEIDPYVNRLQYEEDHWDSVIIGYRETEFPYWKKPENKALVERIHSIVRSYPNTEPIATFVHVLDLAAHGEIKPHIDSVRYCGNAIAGLSLLSDCVMRMRHHEKHDAFCDIFLPRYSLYIIREFARFSMEHEIFGPKASFFKGEPVLRERRVSVISRSGIPEQGPKEQVFKTSEDNSKQS